MFGCIAPWELLCLLVAEISQFIRIIIIVSFFIVVLVDVVCNYCLRDSRRRIAPEVLTLPQLETMTFIPGDSARMSEVVGSRRDLYFSGSTVEALEEQACKILQECFKSDLKSVPMLPTSEKFALMEAARVKDDTCSRVTSRGLFVEVI